MAARFVVIDGNSLVHRAYHALPSLTTSSGRPVGAVYGFAQTVLSLLEKHPPDYAAVAFDPPGPTFRHEIYPAYKANRPLTPPDLAEQFELARQFVEACRLPVVMVPGFEADDVIGTLAVRAAAAGMDVLIVTIDRDCLQLITDRIRVLSPSRGSQDPVLFDADAVRRTYGYGPEQVAAAKSLAGDPSDNIPGVPHVGTKTTIDLLQQYGSLDEILAHPEGIRNKMAREYLQTHAAAIRIAQQLATINTGVPLEGELKDFQWTGLDTERLRGLLTELEFRRLLERLPASATVTSSTRCEVLDSAEEVIHWCTELAGEEEIGICTLTDRENLCGIALSAGEERTCFIPLALLAKGAGGEESLFTAAHSQLPPTSLASAWDALKALLQSPICAKTGGGLKRQAAELYSLGLDIGQFGFDIELASYVLEPQRRDHSVQANANERLQERLPPLIQDRQPQPYAAGAWAAAALRLRDPLRKALAEANLLHLYDELEAPLTPILLGMERAGVAVDINKLRELSAQMERRLAELVAQIHDQAGMAFNIDSPKQLAEVLFTKLGLPVQKRTKSGPSTDIEVLEKLEEHHPIVRLISEYRSFAKLKSTYVDALIELASRTNGRLHTTFEQTVTATGRLSSRDPNLQNIPIRTEWGAKIRSCFVAGANDLWLLSADYSQIELRLLAHFSHDPNLVAAFRAGEDIHRRTASEIFEVPPEQVTSEMRRQAKTVNFAVIYGMGPLSLARQIGVSREEATRFIANYFRKLPGVERYLQQTLEQARTTGYVTTLLGRQRTFPELHSSSARDRSYAERAAINTPLQGSAADIIKVAMVRLHHRLTEAGVRSRLLLQVHDELLLEVPHDEITAVAAMVKEVMESAAQLDVPLVVEVSVGRNWRDLESVAPTTG
ncbi:MAG: DNA polymerase I [Candidatus Zipacnadales bacterium]